MLAILTLALAAHVGSGGVAILSGAGALVARKGGRLHQLFGTVFFFAMLTMGSAASLLAIVAVARGYSGQIANVFAGGFAIYLVTTGWLTVHRKDSLVGWAEVGACVGVLVITAVALFWVLPLSLGPTAKAQGVPVAAPIILAAVAALLGLLDLKVIFAGSVTQVSRTLRHLWRMCLGLFVATGSFFIGQQGDMPAFMQGSPILLLLGFAPLLAIIAWLFAVPRHRRREGHQAAA